MQNTVELEMKRKQPTAVELDIARIDFELARTKAQQTIFAKGFKLEIAKLNHELTQKKAQQTSSTKEQQEGPKFPESTYKAALQTQVVERARKLVPLLNTTKSSPKGKSRQGTQSGLSTGAKKLSPKPRCQDKNQKKPTLKPAAQSQKPNQGSSKKKAILDQLQDQAHIFTNRPKEAAKVPNQMSAKFGKQMEAFVDDLKDNLTKRDEIYLEKINKLEILQDTNAKSLKIITDKVFDMCKSSQDLIEPINASLQRIDNVMTMVHEERERADNKHEDLSREVTITQKQVEEMVQTIKELNEKVNQLQKDAAKKGKNSQVRRVQRSPTLPPPAPVTQVIHLFQPSVQPKSSSGATFTSRRTPVVNDLRYDNQNRRGVHIVGEEHSDLLFLGPPETYEQMRRKEEGKRQYDRRTSYYS